MIQTDIIDRNLRRNTKLIIFDDKEKIKGRGRLVSTQPSIVEIFERNSVSVELTDKIITK